VYGHGFRFTLAGNLHFSYDLSEARVLPPLLVGQRLRKFATPENTTPKSRGTIKLGSFCPLFNLLEGRVGFSRNCSSLFPRRSHGDGPTPLFGAGPDRFFPTCGLFRFVASERNGSPSAAPISLRPLSVIATRSLVPAPPSLITPLGDEMLSYFEVHGFAWVAFVISPSGFSLRLFSCRISVSSFGSYYT